MKNESGFTLVEFLTVILISSILVVVALPSFRFLIQENRLITQTNEFVTMLAQSRSEAIRWTNTVTVCSMKEVSQNDCDKNAAWHEGRVAFSDVNADADTDLATGTGTAACLAGQQDCIFRISDTLGGGNTMTSTGFSNGSYIQFDASGFLVGTAGNFTICDERGEGRRIFINRIGRVRTVRTGINCP